MADIGTILARLTLDTAGFTKGLDQAMGKLDGLVTLAAGVGAALTGMFAAAAAEGLRFSSQLEQLDIAFTTFLGSAEASGAFLEEMKQFAAATPFQFEDVTKGAQKLMALGFAAEETIPVLAAIGDRMSSLGAGAADINRTIRALGQMKGRGMVVTQEMNQLTEVGIKAWDILAKEVGVSTSEIRGMVESRLIDSSTFLKAFMHSTADEVGGMMEKQSQTLTGLVSTLKDNVSMELADAFTPLRDALKPLVKAIGAALPTILAGFAPFIGLLGDAAQGLGWLLEGFNALPDPAQKVIATLVATGTLVVAGFSAAIVAVGAFGFALTAVTSAALALDAALLPVLVVAGLLAGIFLTLAPPLLAITAGVMLLATEATALSYILPAAFGAAIPSLVAVVAEIGKVVAAFMQAVTFSEAVTMAFLNLNRLWAVTVVVAQGLKAILADFWQDLIDSTHQVGSLIPAVFGVASAALRAFFEGVVQGGIGIWNTLITAIEEADGVLGDMRDTAQIFGQTFLEIFAADTVLAAMQAIWKGFNALIQNAMGALLKLVVGLQPLLEKLGLGDVGRQAMSGILNAQVELAGMSENVGAAVSAAMEALANDILNLGDGLKKSFSDYQTALDGIEAGTLPDKDGGTPPKKEDVEDAVEAPTKVLKTLSKFDKLDPIARQAAENVEAAMSAVKVYYGTLVDKLWAGLGQVGSTITSAIEGAKTAGPWGALAAVFVDLLANSETMAAITSTLDDAFGRISDAFGKLLGGVHIIVGNALLLVAQLAEALTPIFELVSSTLQGFGSGLYAFSYIISAIASVIELAMKPLEFAEPLLQVAFEAFFSVIQFIGVGLLAVVWLIQSAWNAVVQGIINALEVLNAVVGGALDGAIDNLEAMKADTDATADALNSLMNLTYDEAQAMSEAAVAADATTEALDAMTASLVNVPAGYKVALSRFAATEEGNPIYDRFVPAMASGGVALGPTLALIGEQGPEAVVPLDRLGDMGGGKGGTTYVLKGDIYVTAPDPDAFLAELERRFKRKAFQFSGNPMALQTPFNGVRR